MVRLEIDGGAHGGCPVVERLPRCAVDEVDADVEPGFTCRCHSGRDVFRVMGAVERCEHVRNARLHADRDAVDAGGGKLSHDRGGHGVRVGLDGHFGVCGEPKSVAHAIEHAGEVSGGQ